MKMLKQILANIYFLVIFFGCNQSNDNIAQIQEKEDSDSLEFHNIDSLKKNAAGFILPQPPFYGYHNFLLADSNRVFYFPVGYDFSPFNICEESTKPEFINLKPDKLLRLKNNILDTFLQSKINNPEETYIVITAPKNNFKHPAAKILKEFIRNNNIKRYYFRKWTEEERNVITSIRNNILYKKDDYKWNETEMINFIPPVLDKTIFPKNE